MTGKGGEPREEKLEDRAACVARVNTLDAIGSYLTAGARLREVRDRAPAYALETLEEMERTSGFLELMARREKRALAAVLRRIRARAERTP